MIDLSQAASEFKAHFEAVKDEAEKYLGDHIPAILHVADKVQGDELVQAALSTFLPPEIKSGLAALIKTLEARYPEPVAAPAAAVDPAMGDPATPVA